MSQSQRRRFLFATSAVLAAPIVWAQQPGRRYRIGNAWVADSATTKPYEMTLVATLRGLGFEVSRNLIFDVRNCDGDSSRLLAAVDELIALKPDLLLGIESVAKVMRSKTATIPIVLTHSTEPVAAGLIQSLRRPGGNVTGVAMLVEDTAAKQVEILGEILPRMGVMALFLDPTVPASGKIQERVRAAAKVRGTKVDTHWVKDRTAIESAFAEFERNRPDALHINTGSGMIFGNRVFIAESALRLRIPTAVGSPASVEAGAFMFYGATLHEGMRTAASYAARILQGANPAEIPVEQPTRFELVINLKTAKVLGLTIPPTVLVRADRLIE